MVDKTIVIDVWNATLKINFTLEKDDIEKGDPDAEEVIELPEPIELAVPRQSYFSLVVEKLRNRFKKFVNYKLRDAPLSVLYHGLPLQMHFPIGVSYDLFAYDTDPTLPWNLTLHFNPLNKLPDFQLLRNSSEHTIQCYFRRTVKIADNYKHGKSILDCFPDFECLHLWQALVDYDFDEFWAINVKLMACSPERPFKYIPFRIYQLDKSSFIEDKIRPISSSDTLLTLMDLVRYFTPELLKCIDKMLFLIHGQNIPVEMPLHWLSVHFSYPDNYLHVCIVPKVS